MSRSGHFEFGLDRRPINSGDTEVTREIVELWSKGNELEGWALYWKDLYGRVADLLNGDQALRRATLLVDYDALCRDPAGVMSRVLAHCELSSADVDLAAEAARRIRAPSYYRPLFSERKLAMIETVTAPVKHQLEALARGEGSRTPR
jgi:hypothetical protein